MTVYHRPPSLTSHPVLPQSVSLSSLLFLCLCVALLLPSSVALPPLGRRSSSTDRRTPYSSNGSPPSPPTDAQSDLAPSDLTPQSHLYRTRPLDAVLSDPSPPSSDPSDPSSPASEPAFLAGARAVNDVNHHHAPVAPGRIHAQAQAGGLYSQQKPVSRVRSKHVHSADEEVPVAEGDAQTQQQPPQQLTSRECLNAEQLAESKKEVRQRLLGVMDQYLAVWQAEEKTDEEIEHLYAAKKDELKLKLAEKKQQLTARACPDVVAEGGQGRRQLLGLEDDDWFDQEEEKVYLIDENSNVASDDSSLSIEDDRVGAVARIVAGGSKLEAEEDDGPHFDASIHPFAMPSAFTSLSERDIQAIHSPTPVPQPKPQPVSPSVEHDVGGIGFIASISPARYSPAPLDSTPVIVVGQRSQRDMDEDLEEERRRRRERLKAIRSRATNPADLASEQSHLVAPGSLPLTDDQLPPGGFIASISPMAPQRASPEAEDDHAGVYIASVGAPTINGANSNAQRGKGSLQTRWRVEEEEEERKAEEGGGVWRSGSRGRLERVVARGRQD